MSSSSSGKPRIMTPSAAAAPGKCGRMRAMMKTGTVRHTAASSRRRHRASSAAAWEVPGDLQPAGEHSGFRQACVDFYGQKCFAS